MNTSSKLSLMAAVVALVCGASSKRSAARPACHDVHGTIRTALLAELCQSGTGMCTAGTIARGGQLDGTTAYQLDALGDPAGFEAVPYSGVLTITASSGTLVLHDMGLLDFGKGIYTEYLVAESGTGAFAGATGTLFASGFVTGGGTGFDGTLTGQLCGARDDD